MPNFISLEIPSHLQANPLLDFSGLAKYDAIKAEHIGPAIDFLLESNRAIIKQMEGLTQTQSVNWDNFVTPMSFAAEALSRAWGMVQHLHGVVDTPELRDAYNANQPKLIEYWSSLSQNLALFENYKALAASEEFASYSAARKSIIEHQLRGFRLGGAELPADKKERFAQIQDQMAALSTKFGENVLDATNDFTLLVEDEAELDGLPADVKQAAKLSAEKAGKQGYQFSLHQPSLIPVLQYASNRSLRERIYQANCTRASDRATVFSKNSEWDNTQNILQLLKLRKEEAQTLGYANFAELSLVPKMADSPEKVMAFLRDLAQKAYPYGQRDMAELRQFASSELALDDLQAWDVGYAAEKLREQRYAFSAQEVKQYFTQEKVLAGLFNTLQTLFNIDISKHPAPSWHEDVEFFHIQRDGKLIGQFYLDLYARAGKQGGAWMDNARSRRETATGLQTPIAYMVCNFTPPVVLDGVRQPVLLTHNEVNTLFHEFGHGIHHLLTKVAEPEVAGINGVEWDAVELPSQMLENFCWEWEVLQGMTAHSVTGEALPRALFDKMLAAKNFQSGMATLRQVEFALIDMHLHYDFAGEDGAAIAALVLQIRQEVAVLMPPEYNRFLHAFSHIFAGGYSAGYYSYKWAEVLSSDAFSAFEEQAASTGSILLGDAGQRFLHEVLEKGSERDALASFTAFRGREPSIDALLRHNGMAQ